jgi:hypothetical protein
MGKIRCILRKVERLDLFVFSVFVVVLLRTNIGLSYEREIILSEEYQTKKEKEVLKDRFRLDLGIGYGFSYSSTAIITGLYELDPVYEAYLDRLGIEFSKNFITMRLTAAYAISPRFGIYANVPFGIVEPMKEKEGLARLSEEQDYEFGIGDISGGIYYHLVPETERIPNVIVSFDLNSNIAEYTSLGNGVWDLTGGLQLRKFLSKSFFLFGLGDYTYTMEEKDVNPGDVIGYGGGIGFLSWGDSITEIGLKAYSIGEGEVGGVKWLDKNEDLVFNLTFKSLLKGGSSTFFIAGLAEGLDFERNTFGFEFSIPIM